MKFNFGERIVYAFIRILIKIMYRVDSSNLDRIPKHGGGIVVCNHVSYIDALLIASICKRPIRFVMDHKMFETPGLSYIFKSVKAIPIAPRKQNQEVYENSFVEIERHLKNDELVCIFPEGMLTRTGELNSFKPGVMQILRNTPVPVIPISLSGLWRSMFSYRSGKPVKKWPKRFRARIDVKIGEMIPPSNVTLELLEEIVGELRGPRK